MRSEKNGYTSAARLKEKALEAYLVAAARSGDRKALASLTALNAPRLLAHAARLVGDRQAAEDAVQSAWVDILRGLPGLCDDAAFRPWAMKIVSRKSAGVIRAFQKDRRLARDWAAEVETKMEAEGPSAVDQRIVRDMIEGLDAPLRATLGLFYLEEMSVAEVAMALDIPVGTVKSRLMNARIRLRGILEGEDHE